MAGHRLTQIGGQIRKELSDLVLREMRDPRVGFVTITQVTVSGDLRHARVGVSCIGDEAAQQETLQALQHAAGFLRSEISKRIRMRTMPQLMFQLDHSMEQAEQVQRTLRALAPELAASAAREATERETAQDQANPTRTAND